MSHVDISNPLPSIHQHAPVHPDAQATVTDFLDYTEFFPSDFARSLQLISNLDDTYLKTVNEVHKLATTYGNLPTLPAKDRPDPAALRKQISEALQHATHCREAAFAEATRLNDVTDKHYRRLASIKRKLQALPKPPSRDPTPAPVVPSPQTARTRKLQELERGDDASRITLHVSEGRSRTNDGPKKHKVRNKRITIPGAVLPPPGSESSDVGSSSESEDDHDDTDHGETIQVLQKLDTPSARAGEGGRVKVPKPRPRISLNRPRPPGVFGTNVHSAVAGISTSNALAKLSPPPPDALPGSTHRPWHKLTEWEMALLRKQMKKNAIWTPSDTMIRRELQKNGRGHENYLNAKDAALAAGEPFLDEEPGDPSKSVLGPGEIRAELDSRDALLVNRGMMLNEAKKKKKLEEQESNKESAAPIKNVPPKEKSSKAPPTREPPAMEPPLGDVMEIDQANKRIGAAGDLFRNLFDRPDVATESVIIALPPKTPTAFKSAKKRKRASTPAAPAVESDKKSVSGKDGATDPKPGPKRLKIAVPSAAPSAAPRSASTAPRSQPPTPRNDKHAFKTSTTTIPLAPAGPETPKVPVTRQDKDKEPHALSPTEAKKVPIPPTPTAATNRPRRISIHVPQARESAEPVVVSDPISPSNDARSATSGITRSRAATASTKAASAEPPAKRELRDHRRGSNISLPSAAAAAEAAEAASAAASASSLRSSGRRRPAPGLVTSEEGGKGKVSVGKRKVAPRRKSAKKPAADGDETENKNPEFAAGEEGWEDIDPDEPRYCYCGGVSYGTMIACENDACDREWFHLPCANMTEIPPRREKWYCNDCRKKLGLDKTVKGGDAQQTRKPR
ncbi:hypothetical protein K402DRAFT_456164 [Aulographum hederae CBS 113979]|uniref:Chromatin modification-related protein n=1 Tax=Aulographum hederae CBS 113979 TaxID=1176131 RepID=A0A6G1GSK2_9PEZI|nr:hypothetical protein K402DRAFT_456164 [Aulographum hederae CBS 113979]